MKYRRPSFLRRLPFCLANFLLMASIVGCAHTSWGLDPKTEAGLTYYHFIKANLQEMDQDDEGALTSMALAAGLDPGSSYLKQETARLYARLGDMETAMIYAKRAVELSPDSPEPRLFAARVAGSAGLWNEAKTYYQDVLRLEPNNHEALTLLGTLYAEVGDLDKAESTFKRLVAVDPGHLSYYYLGKFYYAIGRPKEAIGAFKTALKKNPDFTTVLADLALLYEETGDFKNAEKTYREMIKARPEADMPKARLARLMLKSGRKAEADALLAEVEGRTMPTGQNYPAQILIGRIYSEQGLYEDAAAEFENLLKTDSKNDLARLLLAQTRLEMGERDKAKEQLRKVSKKSDIYGDAAVLLASLTIGENTPKELRAALDIVSGAIKIRPDDSRLWMFQGSLLEDLREYKQARKIFREAGPKFPREADFRFRLGVVEYKLKDEPAAILAMQEALRINPQHVDALNFLAYTWAERRENLNEALVMAEKADALKPDSGYILDTLAWIHYHLGDTRKALTLLEKALPLSNNDPVVLDHMGDVLLTLGRQKEALKAYQEALRQDFTDQEKLLEDLNEKINRLSN